MMFSQTKKIILASAALTLLAGCMPNISPDVIQSNNANEVTNTVQGKIVSMQVITVKGDSDNKTGMIAGGLAGAVAGSAIGGGDRMPLLTGLGGAVVGGIAGNALQDKLTTQQGIQYIVKTMSGKLITVVQGAGSQSYQKGECVYVVEGAHARIVGGC